MPTIAESTVTVLNKLKTPDSIADWVNEVWLCGFSESPGIPLSFEEDLDDVVFFEEALLETISVLEMWARQDELDERGLWTILMEHNLPQKNIVACLFALMDHGMKRMSDCKQLCIALNAASAYTILLQIRGSGAFKVFQPAVMDKVLSCFKLVKLLESKHQSSGGGAGGGGSKRKAPAGKAATGHAKKKRGAQRRAMDEHDNDDNEDPLSQENETVADKEEDIAFSVPDVMAIHKGLKTLLRYVIELMKNSSLLKTAELTVLSCLQTFIKLTRFEPETCAGNFANVERDLSNLNTLPDLAFKGLLVLSSSYGNTGPMMNNIFKNCLPDILMTSEEQLTGAQTVTRHMAACRDNAVHFVGHIMRCHGDIVMPYVRTLLQHVCVKTVDRAEYRQKTAQAIATLLMTMQPTHYCSFMEWFAKYSRHKKAGCRLVALLVLSELLNQPEHTAASDDVDMEEGRPLIPGSHSHIVSLILPRCSDIVGSVRAEALIALTTCLTSTVPSVQSVARQLFVCDDARAHSVVQASGKSTDDSLLMDVTRSSRSINAKTNSIASMTRELQTVHISNNKEISLDDVSGLMFVLRTRAFDDKVNVRRAALQLLEQVVIINRAVGQEEEIEVIHVKCWDVAVSGKKQAIQSLTGLLKLFPQNATLQKLWLDAALELVVDKETGVQEKALQLVWEVIMDNISPYHSGTMDDLQTCAWNLLAIIAKHESTRLRALLYAACEQWHKHGKLTSSLINTLKTYEGTSHNSALWTLLAAVGSFCPKFNVDFVVNYWLTTVSSAETELVVLTQVLLLMQRVSAFFTAAQAHTMIKSLQDSLWSFQLPVELIAEAFRSLKKLESASSCTLSEWHIQLLAECEKHLTAYVCNRDRENLDEEVAARQIFSLGEVCQACSRHITKRHHLLAQSFVAATLVSDEVTASQSTALASSQLSQEGLSQFRGCSLSNRLRAHGFLTLGKMCLFNEALAKKCVAAFARELEVCKDFVIRSNIVMVMCDLSIRYGTLMDAYTPCIANCLKDESDLVRQHTLHNLSRLLKEDYLKWKGSLFYRFVTCLVDEAKCVREQASNVLSHLFHKRHPLMFYQHFIECIYNLNSYDKHPVFNKFSQTDREKNLFSLAGKNNAGRRMKIYAFLLDNMTDEHKFQLTTKICQEILAAIVDEVLPLDAETVDLLKDAFAILSSKEIKLSSLKAKATEDVETEQEMAAAVMNVAKKTLITQVVKKNVVENMIPIIMSLKSLLERNRSPVLRDLMLYLQQLVQDYKTEIQEIFAADRQLAKEVEFDLRKFEEQQLREKQPLVERDRRLSLIQIREGFAASPMSTRRSTVPQAGSPAVGGRVAAFTTPSRNNMPLSRAAIVNSAQRAVEEIMRTARRQSVTDPLGANSVTGCRDLPANATTSLSSTPSKSTSRAISTPSYNVPLSNLTFRDESNLSTIPRQLRDRNSGASATVSQSATIVEDDEEQPQQVLCINLPPPASVSVPTPKWNIAASRLPTAAAAVARSEEDSTAVTAATKTASVRSKTSRSSRNRTAAASDSQCLKDRSNANEEANETEKASIRGVKKLSSSETDSAVKPATRKSTRSSSTRSSKS